jgi:hypothetical protein
VSLNTGKRRAASGVQPGGKPFDVLFERAVRLLFLVISTDFILGAPVV